MERDISLANLTFRTCPGPVPACSVWVQCHTMRTKHLSLAWPFSSALLLARDSLLLGYRFSV